MVLIVNNLLTVFIKQSFCAWKKGFTKLFPERDPKNSSIFSEKSGRHTLNLRWSRLIWARNCSDGALKWLILKAFGKRKKKWGKYNFSAVVNKADWTNCGKMLITGLKGRYFGNGWGKFRSFNTLEQSSCGDTGENPAARVFPMVWRNHSDTHGQT